MDKRKYQMSVKIVLIIMLAEAAVCGIVEDSFQECKQFAADKDIRVLIEEKQKLITPCPCVKQKIELDYSFERIGVCYRQRMFEDGVKQMCCYSSDEIIHIGSPQGGYMLFETLWNNISDVQRNCCREETMCDMFYKINPSDDCSAYQPPVTVTSSGDPTIQTIDGATFDFNGHGEYVFLQTDDLEIQVRLGYVTKGNTDSTLLEAFSIFDNKTGETFEVQFNRSEKDIHVYSNGIPICNETRNEISPRPCKLPPPRPPHCMVLAGGTRAVIIGCGIKEFAQNIVFTAGELMSVSIAANRYAKMLNISGLAGHQRNGSFVSKNGTKVNVNSSTSMLFEFGESWSLKNETESHFNYSITGGNFTFYNGYHTRPRFVEDLVGNLTELFKGYSAANISLFNETCRNYWDNTPNERCLLTIARSGNIDLGRAVMVTVNDTRHKWEILHNSAPYFLEGMPENITAVYKQDFNITIDLKTYVWDEDKNELNYNVSTDLSPDEYTLIAGVFTWNVGTSLRYIDTSFTFRVKDRLNVSGIHEVSIEYCGCEDPSECNFDSYNVNSSGNVIKAGCQCPDYFTGLYCETELDPCKYDIKCFNNNCSKDFDRSLESWPCAPCPKGRHSFMTLKEQKCPDINECAAGYSGDDKCDHNCTNTNGSFTCICRNGYTLNSDKHTCDDVDECAYPGICNGNEICINKNGGMDCVCKSGYNRKSAKDACTENNGSMLDHAVDVKCSNNQWDVKIDMDKLKSLYPGVRIEDIYLGQTHCKGSLDNTTLKFEFSINACDTTEVTSGITQVFNNKLFYAIFDPVIPFLIRQHIWTFAVECDVIRGGTGTSHLHHGIDTHHATFVEHYDVKVELFTDQNFLHLISRDSQTVHVGEDVYVKVSSSIPDWNTKMRLHTCYTRPSRNATSDMEVILINNGCEVDANTHIISQSTHETRFVFQDFEYVTNDEGLDVACNATFCASKDYSPGCVQSCYPSSPTLVG